MPYPPHRGDRIRTFNLLKQISQRHTVSLIAFHDEGDIPEATQALKSYCEFVRFIPLRRHRARLRCALFGWSRTPLQVRYWYDPVMQEAVDQFLVHHPCELIHTHLLRMAQYVIRFRHIPKVLDLCDVLSLNLLRRAQLDRGFLWPLLKLEAHRVEKYEIEIMQHFCKGILVSEVERSILHQRDPTLPLHVVPMGVDLEYFRSMDVEKRSDILFTGTMDYFPNIDAACYFHHEIFPQVKRAIPEARFVIAGSNPSPKLQQLAQDPSVCLTGYVADMCPYFAQASVFVSPMRAGSGMQTKNLEAMAMRLPVVTTPIGLEGLDAVPGRDILLATNPDEYAKYVIALLQDPEFRQQIGDRGRELVEQRYSWEKIGQTLETLYQENNR